MDKTGFANTGVEIVEALINLVFWEDKNLSVRIVESDSESKFANETFEKTSFETANENRENNKYLRYLAGK